MRKRDFEKQPDQAMPEYQMFPRGVWHMLAAVMLMVFSMTMVVMVSTQLLSQLLGIDLSPAFEFGALALLTVILAMPTFLLSRGRATCHTLLLWLNAFCLLVLMGGALVFLLQGEYGQALIGLIGLSCAVGARLLYTSRAYRAGVKHYRLIWAHYRAGTSREH